MSDNKEVTNCSACKRVIKKTRSNDRHGDLIAYIVSNHKRPKDLIPLIEKYCPECGLTGTTASQVTLIQEANSNPHKISKHVHIKQVVEDLRQYTGMRVYPVTRIHYAYNEGVKVAFVIIEIKGTIPKELLQRIAA